MTVSVKPATSTQQGFAHILMVVLLLGGLVSGVYLVGQQTNLFPKAYSPKSPLSAPVTPKPGCTAAYCPSPTPSPVPPSKRVFVTSTTYNGNLGGLSGADSKCQERANVASLGGTWKAWLSDGKTSAASRLAHSSIPYKRVDGKIVANDWSDLTKGNIQNPIQVTENGKTLPDDRVYYTNAWTNTKPDGQIGSSDWISHCKDWTSASYDTGNGTSGKITYTDGQWTYDGSWPCSVTNTNGLYCFEQ